VLLPPQRQTGGKKKRKKGNAAGGNSSAKKHKSAGEKRGGQPRPPQPKNLTHPQTTPTKGKQTKPSLGGGISKKKQCRKVNKHKRTRDLEKTKGREGQTTKKKGRGGGHDICAWGVAKTGGMQLG